MHGERALKIAFMSLFRRDCGGGGGRVAHELAEHFASEHDVVLFCPADRTELIAGPGRLRLFGLHSTGAGDFSVPSLLARDVNRVFDFLDRFQPDVVHAHDPASIGLIGQIWARLHNVPFVHTAHLLPSKILDFGASDAVLILRSSITESIAKRFLADFYQNCDALIALNASAAEDIARFGYTGRVFTIPNGRNLARYRALKPADLSSDERILTFVGYISRRKNQIYLVKALQHLPASYRLQIIGEPTEPSYIGQIRKYIEVNGLQNVRFLGKMRHDDIPALLERTHVFVSASQMEVQSLVLIEALASGTPVVGLANETIDELVDERVGWRVPRTAEPREFAACVKQVCSLPQPAYDAMCRNAAERVKGLDWSNVVAATERAYRTLLSERSATTREQRALLADLVSHLPAGETRSLLMEKVTPLDQKIQQGITPGAKFHWVTDVRDAHRVRTRTWLLALVTVLLSPIAYLLVRPAVLMDRVRRLIRRR